MTDNPYLPTSFGGKVSSRMSTKEDALFPYELMVLPRPIKAERVGDQRDGVAKVRKFKKKSLRSAKEKR
jgi:hypothetical protein